MRHWGRRAVVAALLLVAGSMATVSAEEPAPPPEPSPACEPGVQALAHDGEGNLLDVDGGPAVCRSYTGFPGGESRIEVGNDGTVFFSPAPYLRGAASLGYGPEDEPTGQQWMFQNGGVAVSDDRGASWDLSLPMGASWTLDDALSLYDRDAGRYFWMPLNSSPFPQPNSQLSARDQGVLTETRITATDDNGRTWQIGSAIGVISDRAALTAAPAPAGQAPSVNYPNVLYYCHAFGTNRGTCSKSLDGGLNWTFTGFSHGQGVHPECAGQAEATGRSGWHSVATRDDGSLLAVITCGGRNFLVRSVDEAATWPVVRKIPVAGDLRTDTDGNLYLARVVDDSRILLTVSEDDGVSWTPDIEVTHPEVTRVHSNWYYAVDEPGHVAFTYNGRRTGETTTYDGFITESRNAVEAAPVLWSAIVNEHPLMYGEALQGVGLAPVPVEGSPRTPPPQVNQLGTAFDPHGNPWASFTEDCGPNPDDERCQAQNNQTRGLAAWLEWPAP